MFSKILSDIPTYIPGKPIEEVAREIGIAESDIIKLASNESMIGPSKKCLHAMNQSMTSLHLYPDGGAYRLRKKIGEKIGFKDENIIVGNGSNEILELIGHAFLDAGDEIIISEYSFAIYKIIGKLLGAKVQEIPMSADFHIDLGAIKAAINEKTKIIFLSTINNPTGTSITQKEIEVFMQDVPEHVVIVFDEAYGEYWEDHPDNFPYITHQKNVIITRTFSKIYGLAGLRIGYGVSSKEIIQALQRVQEPFNTNTLAQIAACEALDDDEHRENVKKLTDQGREFLVKKLTEMNLSVTPSRGNFLMVKVRNGSELFQSLLRTGIIIRPLDNYGLPEYVRITIGTAQENTRLMEVLKDLI